MPFRKLERRWTVNERLKSYGRTVRETARMVAPHVYSPATLNHLIETTRRDIYAETVDAMGYDPLERK